MVAMILLRALHKDISRYNAVEAQVSYVGMTDTNRWDLILITLSFAETKQ
jgi:hypothetical protein